MSESVGSNAIKLVDEILAPGTAQMVSEKIDSGVVHNLVAGVAEAALIGTGAAPVLGAFALLTVRLNSTRRPLQGATSGTLPVTRSVVVPGNLACPVRCELSDSGI